MIHEEERDWRTAEERTAEVEQAAAMMDRTKSDWWQQIDPLTLNLHWVRYCIGGQTGLDWNDLATQFYKEGGRAPVFSCRQYEPYWLEEVAKRTPDREPALI